MQKIGFIGAYDKIDFILFIAKILTLIGKKVLIIDSTRRQKAKYVVPAINPTSTYVTEFENIDIAVGFKSLGQLNQYLGINNLEKLYDIVLVDTDNSVMFETFQLMEAKINYFVTSFDVYDLKKGLEALSLIKMPLRMTKILFSEDISQEQDEYLNFLSRNCKIIWNDHKIFFPITIEDLSAISENQRVEKIKFKKLSTAYKENLIFIVGEIDQNIRAMELRKVIKNI